jgi:cytochrome c oxidase subunit IV
LITGFRSATGTAGIIFLVLAAIVWLALPFGHPVYAVVIPPLVLAGIVYAFMRARMPRHPSLKNDEKDGT